MLNVPPKLLAVLVLVAGCGPANSVSGSVEGKAISAKDAIAINNAIGGINFISVSIGEQTNLCPASAAGLALKAGTTVLLVNFGVFLSVPNAITPTAMTYNVLPPGDPTSLPSANGFAYRILADCSPTRFYSTATALQSGTVTVTEVSQRAKGSFDVTLATGEKLTGTFDAPFCATAVSTTVTSCVQ
jgi:hypothetical protein